jgi:hypothetical protein
MRFSSGRPSWASPGTKANPAIHHPELQPANSWSSSEAQSRKFGDIMFIAEIPVNRVLGSARTGFGCLNEKEFVILATDGDAEVYRVGT